MTTKCQSIFGHTTHTRIWPDTRSWKSTSVNKSTPLSMDRNRVQWSFRFDWEPLGFSQILALRCTNAYAIRLVIHSDGKNVFLGAHNSAIRKYSAAEEFNANRVRGGVNICSDSEDCGTFCLSLFCIIACVYWMFDRFMWSKNSFSLLHQ